MPGEFRIGIVGTVSSYTLHFAQALTEMPGATLAGTAHLDRSPRYIKASWNLPWLTHYPQTLEAYAETFKVPLYEQLEEMIAAEKLDAVCITTEDYLHLHHALRAIEQGVHVFVPKPFASCHEEAQRMFDSARAAGVVLLGSLPYRFSPPFVAAHQIIEDGKIGRPISGHIRLVHHLSLGGWKSDPAKAAGPEYEMGFYAFDALRWMMNSEPTCVVAFGANLDHRGIPYIDNGKCIAQFESDALGSVDLYCSLHHRFPSPGMEIIGDEGALRLDRDLKTNQLRLEIYTRSGVETVSPEPGHMHHQELIHWIELCRTGGDSTPWQEEALRTLDFCTAFKRAYQCGAAVTLPLDDAD